MTLHFYICNFVFFLFSFFFSYKCETASKIGEPDLVKLSQVKKLDDWTYNIYKSIWICGDVHVYSPMYLQMSLPKYTQRKTTLTNGGRNAAKMPSTIIRSSLCQRYLGQDAVTFFSCTTRRRDISANRGRIINSPAIGQEERLVKLVKTGHIRVLHGQAMRATRKSYDVAGLHNLFLRWATSKQSSTWTTNIREKCIMYILHVHDVCGCVCAPNYT